MTTAPDRTNRNIFERLTLRLLVCATIAVGIMSSGNAHATTYVNGSFNVSVYQGIGSGAGNDPTQYASPNNPLLTNSASSESFSYTGAVNFVDNGANTVGGFFATSGGSTSINLSGVGLPLSTGGFAYTTLITFTFTTSAAMSGTILHDDGVSLYAAGSTTDLLPVSAQGPTGEVGTAFNIGPGTYTLFYTEVNGLPADLIMALDQTSSGVPPVSQVPEPASIALFGSAVAALVMARRRWALRAAF